MDGHYRMNPLAQLDALRKAASKMATRLEARVHACTICHGVPHKCTVCRNDISSIHAFREANGDHQPRSPIS